MKKLFIGIIIIMCITTVAILAASGVMGIVEEDGFAVPASAGIMQAQSGEGKPIELTPVHYEDEVYETLTGYYVGPERVRIDMNYPLYVRGGTGLRFLTDNVWLITTDVALYQSFEGMYLSEGITYNVDMTQADEEEFILASLSNGLYMNAQQALFEGQLGDIVIPTNSILFLSEDSIAWYAYNNGTLEYFREEAVLQAFISIGEHRYAYIDLLRALGLVQDALEEGKNNRPDAGLLGEAEDILTEIPDEEPEIGGVEDMSNLETEGLHEEELQTGDKEGQEAEKSEGEESDEDSDNESAGLDDELDDENHPAGGDQGNTKPDGSGDENLGDDTQGEAPGGGDKDDSDSEIAPGGDPGDHPDDGDIEDGGEGDKSDDPGGDHDHEGESDGTGGTPGTDTDTDAGDGDEGEKDPDAPKPSKPPTQDGGGEGDTEGDNAENADPGDGGGDQVGENEPAPYREPEVTIRDIELWSYAMSVDMLVDDISGAILRGVSFAVYKNIDSVGLGGDSWTDVHGHSIYAAEDYQGKSTMLRRSRSGSQTFALSTLEPGRTVYVQYSYRYNHVEMVPGVDENGNAIEVPRTTRRQFYSDFIELKVPTVEEGGVKAVAADWSVDFAAHDTAVGLSGLKMANTSDYDSSIVAYDFVNFKKNTLPYVNRLELYATPLDAAGRPDGEAQRINISSSVLSRAQKEVNGTDFDSSAPELLPNREYSYTVVAKDRWGHEIPLVANGVDSELFTGSFYTRKSAPEVKITEVENITDELTIKVTVSDPTSSLVPGQPLFLKVSDRNGEAAYLDGQWNTNKITPGGEDVYELELKEPHDGAEYQLKLNSLFFGTLYNIQVQGDYNPQPDAENAPATLPLEEDVQLGRLSVFTASLSKNPIYFSTSVTDLLDTSATLNMTMTKETALEMLPLVDEFHIVLKDEHGKEVNRTILTQEDLMYEQYTYESPFLTLDEGSATKPKVVLYGTDELYRGNAWDSLCVGYVPSGEEGGSMTLSQPMQLRVMMPKDSLVHFTDYSFSIEALVKKSGKTDQIPVSMTTNSFTTKKTIPEIRYSELFLAADVAEFLDLRIIDPDTTILNNGLVNVYLYYGSTLLSAQQITAKQLDSGEGVDLRFDGIIEGGQYYLKFVATAYNDAEGYGSYQANYELESYEIVGGSALSGKLNLENLGNGGVNLVNGIDVGKDYLVGYLETDKKIYGFGNSSYRTYYIPVEENTEYYVQIPKDSWMTRIGSGNVDPASVTKGGTLMSNCGDSLKIDGNRSFTYTTGEGAQWLYISIAGATDARVAYGLRVVKNAEKISMDGFRADIRVEVHDYFGYLGEDGEKSEVYLSLARSESINEPEYKPYKEVFVLPLQKQTQEDGREILMLDTTQVITKLEANSAWHATLTARYKGSEVMLDELSFQTDGDYVSVSTHRELYEAQRANAYANILVTSDFVQDVNSYVSFYGTVDFQGHKVTRATSGISTYFQYPMYGSVIRNLVYAYPKELYYVNPCTIFPNIYGTVENLIVQTQGQVEITANWKGLVTSSVQPTGVLRNFIVKLADDVIMTTEENHHLGVLAQGNYGLIENGYVYGTGGAGIVIRNITNYAGVLGCTYYNGVMQRCYIICDSWYQGNGGTLLCGNSRGGDNFIGIYAVGDYYSVNAGETNNYRTPLATCRLLPSSPTASGYRDIWALTSLSYTTPKVTQLSSVAQLYDANWQQQMLGSGFDVADSVRMGFYPRLNLPKEMQVHQEYLALPALGQENLPSIISDDWCTGPVYGQHDLDSGYISLRFKNDNNYEFKNVTIEGLSSAVQTQGATNDGFYEVILSVEVDTTEPEYLSSYRVKEFSYVVGNVERTTKSDYSTRNIEFWKAVRTAADWAAINDNMDWNYKLVSDIKFDTAGALPRQIVINGTQADYTSTGSRAYFTGKIDGQEFALQNINLSNIANPYVFYYLSGAEIRNLFVENLTLTGSESAGSYCGFIGYATSSKVENVRIKNAYVAGGGYLGILNGYMTSCLLSNCSVVDSTLTDLDRGRELYAGGISGYFNTGRFYSNYTRNVNISINDTTVVMAIGGLTGYTGANTIESSYAHGSISTNASYVGGLNGQVTVGDGTYVNHSWSYVNIFQPAGNNVGGITAHNRSRVDYCMSLGNIAGAGSATDRISGYGSGNTSTSYAYAGQIVSGMGNDNKGDAGGLLDGDALSRKVTWQDTIQLGSAWNYTPVERGSAPLLAMDCSRSGWTQQDIPLPGQAGDPVLQVTAASYLRSGDVESYIVQARLEHPNMESSELQAMYAANPRSLKIDLKGMDLSDSAQSPDRPESERTVVILQQDGDNEEATIIQITTHDFLSALDSYPLTIEYMQGTVERELSAMVEYLEVTGEPHRNYWEIRNIGDWNRYAPLYGFNGENFRIVGDVDFAGPGGAGSDTEYKGLIFNRLEGVVSVKEDGSSTMTGFKNLAYNGLDRGQPWIEKVAISLKDISFSNMSFTFSSTGISRVMTGAIISTSDVSNLRLNNIKMSGNQYTRGYFGFISNHNGILDGVYMDTVELTEFTTSGSNSNYCGALIAKNNSEIRNVEAHNITVNRPKNSYVGAIAGNAGTYGTDFTDIYLENFTVVGYTYVGGLAGQAYNNTADNSSALGKVNPETNTVTGRSSVTGVSAVGGMYGPVSMYERDNLNWRIEGVDVKATGSSGYAGVVTPNVSHVRTIGVKVVNCSVEGNSHVGGLIGTASGGWRRLLDVEIIDTDIINHSNSEVLGTSTTAGVSTGGLIGRSETSQTVDIQGVVISNCEISGPAYVGGLVGHWIRDVNGGTISRVYVDEDSSVTARNSCAGGLFGYANVLTVSDCASGATVTAGTEAAGGLVGHLEPFGEHLNVNVKQMYYRGLVSAGLDFAGGLIGRLNSGHLKLAEGEVANAVVAADIRTAGKNASFWVNDTTVVGDAGVAGIYVMEESVLNGQTARAVTDAGVSSGSTTYVVPALEGVELLKSAEVLNTKAFWESLNFNRSYTHKVDNVTYNLKYWNLEHIGGEDNLYMPYTTTYEKNIEDPDQVYASVIGGIRLMNPMTVSGQTKVYASGVDSINIEKPLPEGATTASVTIKTTDGTEMVYATDSNGILSLNYDFMTDFYVDDVLYKAEELVRRVMTYGIGSDNAAWYYLDSEGYIHFGHGNRSVADMKELGKSTVQAVHLWQGYAMVKEAGSLNTYALQVVANNLSINLHQSEAENANLTPLMLLGAPLSRAVYAGDGPRVYHDFTLSAGVPVPYRVFYLGGSEGTPFFISPAQGAVYDGVFLAQKTTFGQTSQWFATLGTDGVIQNYLTELDLKGLSKGNKDIDHMSNSLGFDGTALLVCYEDGSIEGVDIASGTRICPSSDAEVTGFFSYALRSVANLFRSDGGPGVLSPEGSYLDGLQEQFELEQGVSQNRPEGAAPEEGEGQDGDVVADGVGGAENEASGDMPPVEGVDMDGLSTMDGAVVGGGTEVIAGDTVADGGTQVQGDAAAEGEGGAQEGAAPAGGGVGAVSGAGAVVSGNGDAAGVGFVPANGGTGAGGTNAVGGADSVPNGSESGTEDAEGQAQGGGTAADALLPGTPEGETGSSPEGERSEEEILRELFGESVVLYSEDSGQYELMETVSMMDNRPRTMEEALAEQLPAVVNGAEEDDKGFSIAWGLNRHLDSGEKRGFALLTAAAVVAAAVLIVLYFTVVRKRKVTKKRGKH